MKIHKFNVGHMDNLSYLIESKNSFILIDPSFGFDEFVSLDREKFLNVFITHGHYDHVMNLIKIVERFPKIRVYFNSSDSFLLPFKLTDFIDVALLDEVEIDELKVKILKTPGHSPGSVCYLVDKHLFSGDTLFYDSCGRVDLPGSDPNEMRSSLLKILLLGEDIIVHPGHDYGRGEFFLSDAKKLNPYLKYANDERKFFSIL